MRNATEADVKKAQEIGKLEENVMYSCTGQLIHGKKVRYMLESFLKRETGVFDAVIAETAQGELVDIALRDLKPLAKGPAQQPKRIKRKPVKGTKPEQLIEMNESVKLKAGDKVLLKNGFRAEIVTADSWGYSFGGGKGMFKRFAGVTYPSGTCVQAGWSITHKIIPWQEQERCSSNIDPAHSVLKWVEPKSPDQEAFEKGYWVPHQAQPDSMCPSFAAGWKVDYLMRDMQSYRPEYAENLRWNVKGNNADIVAFRKASNQ